MSLAAVPNLQDGTYESSFLHSSLAYVQKVKKCTAVLGQF